MYTNTEDCKGIAAAMAATRASTVRWSTRRNFHFPIVIFVCFFLFFINDYTLLLDIRRITGDLPLGVSRLKSFYMLTRWGLFSVVYLSYNALCAT